MTTKKKLYREETKFKVLRLLKENPEYSTRQLVKYAGISDGSVCYNITKSEKRVC